MKNNIITPIYNENGIFVRKIRSFVSRKGRITKSQANAIQRYWELMGIQFQSKLLNFSDIFNNFSPVILEIGFGSGRSLVQNAINFSHKNFLGIEVYTSGVGSCLHLAYNANIHNLKIICHDAVEVLNVMIPDRSLSVIQIFFPDPWHKRRHNKRRMLQSYFLEILSKKLICSGTLHIVTDSKEYALYVLNQITHLNNYVNLSKNNNFIERPVDRIFTDFEKKAQCCKNRVFDLMFQVITNNCK